MTAPLKVTYADGVDAFHDVDINATNARVNTNTADIAAAQVVAVNAKTASYTLVLADGGNAVEVNKATAGSVTVPPNSSVPFPVGTVIEIVQTGAGQITVTPGSGVTINGSASLMTRVQWSTLVIRKRAADTWICSGDSA